MSLLSYFDHIKLISMDPISVPFDEFEDQGASGPKGPRGPARRWTQSALRALSFGALWVAILTAAFIVLTHAMPMIIGSQSPVLLKSGIPLMAIGLSYISLVLTLQRTPGQRLVGILMGLAFVLWGLEQFLPDRALIPFIDDCVVFLFVVDLSIVIRHNFRECAGEGRVRKNERQIGEKPP